MSNDYFNAATLLTRLSKARSGVVNTILESIAAGFDLLPGKDALNQGRVTYVADSGAADAYVVTLSPVPASYVAGLRITMKATNVNTGASTLNVNSLGARSIKGGDGNDPAAGDIPAGGIVEMVYDGTNFVLMSTPSGFTTAAAASASAAATSASGASTSATNAAASAVAAAASAVEAAAYAGDHPVLSKAAGYTVVGTDKQKVIRCTAALTLSLTAAATLEDGFSVVVIADGGDVIIDPDASETIDGSATVSLPDGTMTTIYCDGTNWQTKIPADPNDYAALSGATFTGDVQFDAAIATPIYTLTGTTPALDPNNGSLQTWTLTANSTPTDSLANGEYIKIRIDDGTSYTVTWPTMTWVEGTAPALAATGWTHIILWKEGTTLYGKVIGEF